MEKRTNQDKRSEFDALYEMVRSLSEQNARLSLQLESCMEQISIAAGQQAQLRELVSNQLPQLCRGLKEEITAGTAAELNNTLHTMDARISKTERLLRRRFDAMLWNILFETKQDSSRTSVNQSSHYDYIFYLNNRYHSMVSAQHILQPVFQHLQHRSVVDFGCGTGTWLWVAQALGAESILGYDGDYVPRELLMIPERCFVPTNLEQRFIVPQKYDLAISMEVAEHLPSDSADTFVENIAGSSDTVLFSAAHPGQGGTDHINEQPVEYWIEKFKRFGFSPVEIKQHFQNDNQIAKWYRDNVILFLRR